MREVTDPNEHAGMTLNERLVASRLVDEFDRAVVVRDRDGMMRILESVHVGDAAAIADTVLADPSLYGFHPPRLVRPLTGVRSSYLAAIEEFRAEGRLGDDDRTGLGHEWRDIAPDADDAAFAAYVEQLLDRAREDGRRPEGWVPDTLLWFVAGPVWIGRLDIRHRLTPILLEAGGHIGYDVRPSMRRRGYATQMLREALPIAAGLGINPALLTCDVTNVASRKVIEANGGVLEDERNDKLRFWVSTIP